MALATCSRSVAVPRQSGVGSLPCRRVAARAAVFEEYVLDLQSSIKSEAERLEVGSGKAVTFQDDRCDPTPGADAQWVNISIAKALFALLVCNSRCLHRVSDALKHVSGPLQVGTQPRVCQCWLRHYIRAGGRHSAGEGCSKC